MTLPFAVYTAFEGYSWATDLGDAKPVFDAFRNAIGKSPDVEMGDSLCAGALNSGETVIVYRFLKATEWDSKKRDAIYLAMTFFRRSEAESINFSQLLSLPWFTDTLRNPPTTITYEGSAAVGSDFDFLSHNESGYFPPEKDMSCMGSLFSKSFDGVLRIKQEQNNASIRLSYTPTMLETGQSDSAMVNYVPIQESNIPRKKCNAWEKLAAAIAIPISMVMIGYFFNTLRFKEWNKTNMIMGGQMTHSEADLIFTNLCYLSLNSRMQFMPSLYGYYNWSKTNLVEILRKP